MAAAIVADAIATTPDDGSLRGAAALLLAAHELGVRVDARRAWTHATHAALDELDASFFDGLLGSAWVLSQVGSRAIDLDAIDAAVLDTLASPWDGGLAPFAGGLAGFGVYGLARSRTRSGKRIVARCVALFESLAIRSGSELRWTPSAQTLPEDVRDRPSRWRLCNMEGSAAAVGFLAAAARGGVKRALPLAKAGGRTLAADVDRDDTADIIGVAANFAAQGTVHGSGTWALGGAGVAAALLGVSRATGIERDRDAAVRFGRKLADADPLACHASDASLGTGTAGIAVVLQALYEATGLPLFRIAAEYWYRRTLACRTPGSGLGGYQHYDALRDPSEGGARWQARPGLLEGAIGTALALRCVSRGTSGWCACMLL